MIDALQNFFSKDYPGSRQKILGIPVPGSGTGFSGFSGPYSIFRVPSNYYLEIRKGSQVLTVISFPYDPDEIQYSRANPISVTHTLTGVHREASSIKAHQIVLGGRSGLAERVGYNRDGEIVSQDGETIFKEFDEFLKKYIEMCNKDFGAESKLSINYFDWLDGTNSGSINLTSKGLPKNISMILRCIKEDIHLYVEPIGFQFQRTASNSRLDYEYSLNLRAYDYAYTTAPTNPILSAFQTWDSITGAVGGAIGLAENAVNNISNDYILGVRGAIADTAAVFNRVQSTLATVGGAWENAVGVYSDVCNLGDTIGNTCDAFPNLYQQYQSNASARITEQDETNGVEGRPNLEEADGVATVEVQFALRVHSEGAANQSDDESAQNSRVTAAVSTLLNNLQIARGNIPRELFQNVRTDTAGSPRTLGEFLSSEENLGLLDDRFYGAAPKDLLDKRKAVTYVLNQDEDLMQVAQKTAGDVEVWNALMIYNNWRDARRNQNGDLAKAGDVIFIPQTLLGGLNNFTDPQDLYGTDISMPYDDIEISVFNQDFKTVTQIENLEQAIKNRLLTFTGELPGFTDYGLPQLSAVNDVGYTSAQVRNSLTADNRVIDVPQIEVQFTTDTLFVQSEVLPIVGEKIDLKVPVYR